MDNRVINTLYSVPAMQLAVKLANLCLSVPVDQGAPNFPYILSDTVTISQTWGESPSSGGIPFYFRLSANGDTVYMWDPETSQDFFDEDPTKYTGDKATHTFSLSEMDDFIAKWLVGDV